MAPRAPAGRRGLSICHTGPAARLFRYFGGMSIHQSLKNGSFAVPMLLR